MTSFVDHRGRRIIVVTGMGIVTSLGSEGLDGCCSAVQLLRGASFEARPTASGERLRMTR